MSKDKKAKEDIPLFLNRELSWIEFNFRVLGQAEDASLPPLERLKFAAITASNADEFFMVRVGGLKMLERQGEERPDPAGLAPAEQLAEISARMHALVERQHAGLAKEIEPALRKAFVEHKDDLVFLDIRTAREANVFPMVAAGKGLSEMIMAEDL